MSAEEEFYLMRPPVHVVEGLDDHYQQMINDAEQQMISHGLHTYMQAVYERCDAKDEWLYDIPHPARKRWAGFVPIHHELMVQEHEAVALLMTRMSRKQVRVQDLVYDLMERSPSFKELVMMGNTDKSSNNLGALDPMFHPHVHLAKGGRLFKISDERAAMLMKADMIDNAPAGLLRMPYPNVFIHAKPGFTINNPVSGDHEVDGFYVNHYIVAGEHVKRDWDEQFKGDNRYWLNKFLAEKGILTKDGGDIHGFEIVAMGRPKDSIFDDATFSFGINVQNPNQTLDEVFNAHIEHYQTRTEARPNTDGLKYVNATDMHAEQMRKSLAFVLKSLLYINSQDTDKERIMELSDLKRERRITSMSAKKRKLDRKIAYASDYTLIK